jgi:hypothetical protein
MGQTTSGTFFERAETEFSGISEPYRLWVLKNPPRRSGVRKAKLA